MVGAPCLSHAPSAPSLPSIRSMTQLFHNEHELGKTGKKKHIPKPAACALLNNKHIKMLIKSCFSTESGGKMLSHAAESDAACFSVPPRSQTDAKTKLDAGSTLCRAVN